MREIYTVKGSCIAALEPMTDKQRRKNEEVLAKHSRRFYNMLTSTVYPVPTLFKLMVFRMSRTSLKLMLNDNYPDYGYYRDQGWLESDYYYPTKLVPLKKVAGVSCDWMATRMSRRR